MLNIVEIQREKCQKKYKIVIRLFTFRAAYVRVFQAFSTGKMMFKIAQFTLKKGSNNTDTFAFL